MRVLRFMQSAVEEAVKCWVPGCSLDCGRAGRDLSDDRPLIVHSHDGVLPECVACVVVGSEIGAEYTKNSGVAW